jgi:dihydropteroate synthase-like protein
MAEHYHFVTGRLAEHALREQLQELATSVEFTYSVDVLPITVAALMTPPWIARHVNVPAQATRIMLPGYCEGDVAELEQTTGLTVEHGPRDLRQLAEHFGREDLACSGYGEYDIEILAEINHAPRLPLKEILRQAKQLRDSGADLIDVGCDPGEPWTAVGTCVKALCDAGHRVSIDSFHPKEIEPAVRAGAELVLSVNASNRDAAPDWGCEVVVIPDDFATLGGLDDSLAVLRRAHVPFRIDPVLEPIGCGFAASLGRYIEARQRYPDAEMMMGIGNLTELTDADSAPINVLLLGICQELGIRSVLTTQVINWARSSVKECDVARRLVHFAIQRRTPPKHLEPGLVMLRDEKLPEHGNDLDRLASQLKDSNYRLFAEGEQLHLIAAGLHLQDRDPFALFEQLLAASPKNMDATHAFYLGFELSKALTALTLGKLYEQDEALDWGLLTEPEQHHRLARKRPPSS